MRFLVIQAVLLASLGLTSVQADKDTDFYYSGFTNPNVHKKMFWKDSYNVLEDLDQFSALYIRYHNCVHSLYPRAANSDQDEDNEGYDYWYLYGVAPNFQANAAFSLYGVLKDGGARQRNGSYCHKGTYINSFFTNTGVETIAGVYGLGDGVSSSCGGGDGGEGEGGRDLQSGDQAGGETYGMGCYDGQFVYGTYSGGGCTGTIQSVSNSLDDLNSGLEALDCVQIYDESGSVSSSSYNDDAYDGDAYGDDAYNDDAAAGDDAVGDDAAGDDAARRLDDGGSYDPLDILTYSESCRIEFYGDACPDPYGVKKGYEKSLSLSLMVRPTVNSGRGKWAIEGISVLLTVVGLVLFCGALFIRCKYGGPTRIVDDKGDALLTPEKAERPRSFIKSLSSSASKKARELKEKFQEFAEEEVEEEDATSPTVAVVDTPEAKTLERTPSDADTASSASSKSSNGSFEKIEAPSADESSKSDFFGPPAPATPPTTFPPTPVDVSTPEPAATSLGATEAPSPAATETTTPPSPVAAESTAPVVSAVPAASITSPTTPAAPTTALKKKKKRPVLNKISKSLFGRKNKSGSVKGSSSASV